MHLQEELASILKNYVGRESPLYHAERLSEYYRKCVLCACPYVSHADPLQGGTLHRSAHVVFSMKQGVSDCFATSPTGV